MGSPVYPISPSFGGGSGTYDHSQLTNRDAADQHPVTSITGAASKTESDLTLYVYEDATGTGDGSSKANGFTNLQDAIDAIPDVAQNVTVIVSKGSTNYLGDTTTIQKASVKSLTIRGEFYAYGACGANDVAGKVVNASADFSHFEVGDRVVCTKYSGTVGSSSINDYFYATVTEVGSGYVQTSEETKVPTTGWRFLITQTVFDTSGSTPIVDYTGSSSVNVTGLCISGGSAFGVLLAYTYAVISRCIFTGTKGCVVQSGVVDLRESGIVNIPTNGTALYGGSGGFVRGQNLVFACAAGASGCNGISLQNVGSASVSYAGFFGFAYASFSNTVSPVLLSKSYIDSTCTVGVLGSLATLSNVTNTAVTPISFQLSGVNAKYWGGLDLPDTTGMGGKYLRLKSDATGFEFVDLP